MEKIEYKPIGIIHSPLKEKKGAPIQPRRGRDVEATIEIFAEFIEGLSDLDGFSHILLVYHLHQSSGFKLKVVPFLDTELRGLFATRAPRRPNPIGISVVRLDKIEGGTLYIRDIDMLDGTPVLDIKPHVPHFDENDEIRIGWLEGLVENADQTDADSRFNGDSEQL